MLTIHRLLSFNLHNDPGEAGNIIILISQVRVVRLIVKSMQESQHARGQVWMPVQGCLSLQLECLGTLSHFPHFPSHLSRLSSAFRDSVLISMGGLKSGGSLTAVRDQQRQPQSPGHPSGADK